jgi:integral membrane sensor domain MASE1
MREYRSRAAWLVLLAGIAAVYAATGCVCAGLSAVVANVSWMLYIPAGLSLTAALMWGSRVWPAVFAGELLMGIWTGQGPVASPVMAFGNAMEAALAGWWFHDRQGRRIELDRIQEVVQLLAGILLVLQPLCTLVGIAGLYLTHAIPPHRLGATAAAWYSADIYAQLLAAPTAISWLRWPRLAGSPGRRAELAAVGAATLVIGALGPGRWAFAPLPLTLTLLLVFPLLAWAAIRFPPSVALTVGTVLGLFAFDAAIAGIGPFRGGTVAERMVSLNVFMSVSMATGLFIAAAAANERRFEEEQRGLIAKLQAAADQVSRLEEFVTFCAWSGRVHWKNEWVSVEKFLSERYGLNISHGISDESMVRILTDAGLTLPPRLAGREGLIPPAQ